MTDSNLVFGSILSLIAYKSNLSFNHAPNEDFHKAVSVDRTSVQKSHCFSLISKVLEAS